MPPNELPMIISLSWALNQKEFRRRGTANWKRKKSDPLFTKSLIYPCFLMNPLGLAFESLVSEVEFSWPLEAKWYILECSFVHFLDPKHFASVSRAFLIRCQFVQKVEVRINYVGENRSENVFIFFSPLYAFIILFLKLTYFHGWEFLVFSNFTRNFSDFSLNFPMIPHFIGHRKVLFGTQERKNTGTGKPQELRWHTSTILWKSKSQE
jgi:hypothetical protein